MDRGKYQHHTIDRLNGKTNTNAVNMEPPDTSRKIETKREKGRYLREKR
jgi:hypothetical protein